jgi:hypothetical protein
MTVFVATSKRFYRQAEAIVKQLKDHDVSVYHPYFDLNSEAVDADPGVKSGVTLQHFLEIDESDVFYALLPDGYIGCSATIELSYAYAKGKRIVASSSPTEYAVRAMIAELSAPDAFIARFT